MKRALQNVTTTQWLLIGLTVILVGLSVWAWFTFMEKRWLALPHQSPEAARNPMLAAERLLTEHGYSVRADGSLQSLLRQPLPDGTVMLTETGVMTDAQAEQLLDWVAEGNTLVLQPQWQSFIEERSDESADETEGDASENADDYASDEAVDEPVTDADDEPIEELVERDPIGEYFAVGLGYRVREPRDNPAPILEAEEAATTGQDETGQDETAQDESAQDETAQEPAEQEPSDQEPSEQDDDRNVPAYDAIQLPAPNYPLLLQRSDYVQLHSLDEPVDLAYGDEHAVAIRVYREGEGQVVFLAENYFTNYELGRADHGEVLLALIGLSGEHKAVQIITDLDMPAWYEALWLYFKWALLGVAAVLLIWLWRAVVRFGPLVPEPDLERRAQLEHVDAAARWLWQLDGGREQLLTAVRADVEAHLRRYLPELIKLVADARLERIATACQLSLDDVRFALQAPVARLPVEFTRQMYLLQILGQFCDRKDHDRKH